jgi:hypothetical protein
VSDELFTAVEQRFETTKKLWGVGGTGLARGQQKQVYLFSGLLRCGECGGSITLAGGRAKTRSEYGCSLHAQRRNSICKNGLRIQRRQIEEKLLTGLQEKVLRQEFIDYAICGLQEELCQRHDSFCCCSICSRNSSAPVASAPIANRPRCACKFSFTVLYSAALDTAWSCICPLPGAGCSHASRCWKTF